MTLYVSSAINNFALKKMDSKICSKCQQEKPFQEFYRNSRSKDNHASQCKICRKSYRQQKRLTQLQKDIEEWYEPEF